MSTMHAYQKEINKFNFASHDETFNYLRENKHLLKMLKKSEIKHCDGVFNTNDCGLELNDIANKAVVIDKASFVPTAIGVGEMPDKFKIKVIINTTNIMDSHDDVHINGLFVKSQKETKLFYLFKEHKMQQENIIADSVRDGLKALIENYTWAELGYKYEGQTQALTFEGEINAGRNKYMAEQYWGGYVYNHSVGMLYIDYVLCMNSQSKYDEEELKNWTKYYPVVANKEYVDSKGYFWAVLQARFIEGSSVPLGSNQCTPTLIVGQPKSITDIEPFKNTHENSLSWLLG